MGILGTADGNGGRLYQMRQPRDRTRSPEASIHEQVAVPDRRSDRLTVREEPLEHLPQQRSGLVAPLRENPGLADLFVQLEQAG